MSQNKNSSGEERAIIGLKPCNNPRKWSERSANRGHGLFILPLPYFSYSEHLPALRKARKNWFSELASFHLLPDCELKGLGEKPCICVWA